MRIHAVFKIMLFLLVVSSSYTEDWNYSDTIDGVKLYKKEAVNGIIPFKAEAEIKIPIKIAKAVLLDLNQKNKWSPKLERVKVHKQIDNNTKVFSEYYSTPWPAKGREFLLHGTVIENKDKSVTFSAYSLKASDALEYRNKNYIQAEVSKIEVILKDGGDDRTFISFEFQGDLKGWMPKWLSNLIQKKWPKKFIKKLESFAIENNYNE